MQKVPKQLKSTSQPRLQQIGAPMQATPRLGAKSVFRERTDRLSVQRAALGNAERRARRRRSLEAGESEILDATESFLRGRPFKEMTVYDVMSRTSLARSSFYEYFRDRYHLLAELGERLSNCTCSIGEHWSARSADGDEIEMLKASIDALVGFYVEHGPILRALADASTDDPRIEAAYRKLTRRFVEATISEIRIALEGSTTSGLDPDEIATALVLISERYPLERLCRSGQGDPMKVAQTLFIIWKRLLY